MRIECDYNGFTAVLPGKALNALEDALVSTMYAIERANGDYGIPESRECRDIAEYVHDQAKINDRLTSSVSRMHRMVGTERLPLAYTYRLDYMPLDNNRIVEALRQVADPVSGQDIIAARRVSDLKIQGNSVVFALNTDGIAEGAKQELNFKCIEAVQRAYPEAEVHIHMQRSEGQKGTVMSQVANIIAVGSGKGGVGKSTVSVNLALGLKQLGYRVGLIDADLYGPSIPTMLGLQDTHPKVIDHYGQPKIIPPVAFDMPVISIGFIVEPEKAVVLRGPRLAGIIKQFIFECLWPPLDYLIIDLPPGTGDIQLTLVQTVPVTGAVIVTTPQEVAVADAIKALNMFRMENINVPILGIVENMSWFTPAELPESQYYLFGRGGGARLAEFGETELLAQIPLIQSVRESGDSGKPGVLSDDPALHTPFRKLAQRMVERTTARNANQSPTKVVQVE
jgi:ATP-binding protein involved in chromosome partitioning